MCSLQSATVKYLLFDAITGSGLSGWNSGLLPADVQHCARLVQRPLRLQRQHDRRHHPAPHHWPKRCWSSKCIMYVNCSFPASMHALSVMMAAPSYFWPFYFVAKAGICSERSFIVQKCQKKLLSGCHKFWMVMEGLMHSYYIYIYNMPGEWVDLFDALKVRVRCLSCCWS